MYCVIVVVMYLVSLCLGSTAWCKLLTHVEKNRNHTTQRYSATTAALHRRTAQPQLPQHMLFLSLQFQENPLHYLVF